MDLCRVSDFEAGVIHRRRDLSFFENGQGDIKIALSKTSDRVLPPLQIKGRKNLSLFFLPPYFSADKVNKTPVRMF